MASNWNDLDLSAHHFDDDTPPQMTSAEAQMTPEVPKTKNINKKGKTPQGAKKQTGFFNSLRRGVRSIWATRQIEDTTNNRELRVKTTLRELVIYCFFLLILTIMTFGMMSPTMFTYSNTLNNLFIQTPGDVTNPGSNFLGVNLPGDFFDYLQNVLVPGLYSNWESWYNKDTTPYSGFRFIFYESKLQGVPRIRQVRVNNQSCSIPDDFKSQIKACYAAYSSLTMDTKPYGLINGTAWSYSSEKKLKGSSLMAEVNSYDGGGYYIDLNTTSDTSLPIIQNLKDNLWIDRATRAVFVDFTLYNANINLFCIIKLIAELPPTGGIIPSYIIRPVKLIRYNTIGDFVVLASEFIFCIFVIYYIVEEFLEIKKLHFSYLKEFWNVLDILVVLISICCIAFDIYCFLEVRKLLDHMSMNPDSYVDFDFISYWQVVFNAATAIMVFFAWIKIFKYISFNKTMTQLSSTLGACAKDLGGFAIMFFIIFLAFAQLGYLMFGTQAADFSTYSSSIFTLFRIILGDFNFQALQQANRVLGPTYFILYVFFVFFVLLNMFLAIINDTYSEVKAELAEQPNDIDVAGYFKERANKMLIKLNLKKKKIIEIQKAMDTADINGDNIVDFNEWKQDLKQRGYEESEIEAVFAKYDINGDRLLDENELRKMQNDLENQKISINEEMSKGPYNDKTDKEEGYETDDEAEKKDIDANGEEFTLLQRRVDRMENSIGSIVSRIDGILAKLEAMELAKAKRRDNIGKLIDNIAATGSGPQEAQEQIEKVVKDEMNKWDKEHFVPKPTF